ncbi:hypothetical protein BJX70DRAFT_386335 [Aspergillus crustosus]
MTLHSDSQSGTLTRASLQKYLVLVGIDDIDSTTGFTALSHAIKNGHPSVVKLLLQAGASPSKPVRDGRTPLYLAANAKQNRARIVQLLLAQKPQPDVDAVSGDWGNETPLIVAITQGRDAEVVKLLVEAGASVNKTNDRGETAVALADQSTNAAIKNAINPKAAQGGVGSALAQLLVSAVVFAVAYADKWPGGKEIIQNAIRSAYNQVNPVLPGGKPPVGTDIDDPQTADDFKHNIGNIIQESGLDDFFPPNDPYERPNHLNTPIQINKLARLALYQPILYVDDSGSMQDDSRMDRATALVKRMTTVATLLVPDNKGIHLRFINKDDSTANNLRAAAVEQRMKFTPEGWTEIGTNLKKKVLQPFVYDVISGGAVLPRPVLVLTITDGMPTKEDAGVFRNAIVDCKTQLVAKAYQKEAVRFDLSQVGNDPEAINFIDSFEGDADTEDVLHRTAEHTDARFEDLRKDEKALDNWLLDKLSKPVTYKL